MRRILIILGVIAGIGLLIFGYFNSVYNTAVRLDEESNEKWSNVQSAYQRRFDLVDNLVSTVKGAADFEKETLTRVIEARSKATSVQLTPEALSDPKFQSAQNELKGALSRLLIVAEQYPQLTATQNFRDLQ